MEDFSQPAGLYGGERCRCFCGLTVVFLKMEEMIMMFLFTPSLFFRLEAL